MDIPATPCLLRNRSTGGRAFANYRTPDAAKELDQAKTRFRSLRYRSFIMTGRAVPANLYQRDSIAYAELARDYLIRYGVPGGAVTAGPAPESAQDRTTAVL